MHDQNDARGAVILLARAARGYIQNPAEETDREIALNNVYRLLESYRAHPFFGADLDIQPFPFDSTDGLTLVPPAERNVGDVRDAVRSALQGTFGDLSAEVAIDLIEAVLRNLAYPTQHPLPQLNDRERVGNFFHQLLETLQK
jgi:hypothetical protein